MMEEKHIEAMRRWVLWYSGKLPERYGERRLELCEAVKAAIRDAEQPQQAMEWLPIETHPGFSDPCLVRVRYYESGICEGVLVCEARKVPGCPWAPCSGYESFDDMLCCDATVTHWMPMPSPDIPLAGQAALDLSPAAQITAEYDELAAQMTREYVQSLEQELSDCRRRLAEMSGLVNRSNDALRTRAINAALTCLAPMTGIGGRP